MAFGRCPKCGKEVKTLIYNNVGVKHAESGNETNGHTLHCPNTDCLTIISVGYKPFPRSSPVPTHISRGGT